MKNWYVLLVFIGTFAVSFSQELTIRSIDKSNYPLIKTYFNLMDADNNPKLNSTVSNYRLEENTVNTSIYNLFNPSQFQDIPFSALLAFDLSSSMTSQKMQLAKFALNQWLKYSKLGVSECAIMGFNDNNYLLRDFSTDSLQLSQSLENVTVRGNDNPTTLFMSQPNGVFNFINNATNPNKVIIIINDGININYQIDYNAIYTRAAQLNIPVYVLSINSYANTVLSTIATSTGGECFNYMNSQNPITKAIKLIALKARQIPQSFVTFNTTFLCRDDNNRTIQLKYNPTGSTDSYNYNINELQYEYLSFDIETVHFKNPPLYFNSQAYIVAEAKNGDIRVTNITSSNPNFKISPTSFILNKNQKQNLTVTYKPNGADSSYNWTTFTFITDKCQYQYFASAGYTGKKPKAKTLKITSPNGAELICGGGDTLITWEGIPLTDTVKIEYSLDNGANWILLSDTAVGGSYRWLNIPKSNKNKCLIRIAQFQNKINNNFVGLDYLRTIDESTSNYYYYSSWEKIGNRIITHSDQYSNYYSVLWDAETGDSLASFSNSNYGYFWWNGSNSWNYSSEYFILQNDINSSIIYSANDYTAVDTIENLYNYYYSYGYHFGSWFAQENKYIFTDSTFIKIYDLNTRSIVYNYNFQDTIYALSLNPVNNDIVLLRTFDEIIIFNLSNNQIINRYNSSIYYYDYYNYDIWDPTGRYFAIEDQGAILKVYDYNLSEPVAELNNSNNSSWNSKVWNYDGSLIMTKSAINELSIYETQNWSLNTKYTYNPNNPTFNYIYSWVWNPVNNFVAISTMDSVLTIIDGSSGEMIYKVDTFNFLYYYLTWNYNGELLSASKNINLGIDIWRFNSSGALQIDTSDAVFSIIIPQISAKTIDMGNAVLSSTKDSLITEFIKNDVKMPIRIDTVFFTGAEADCFAINEDIQHSTIDKYLSTDARIYFTPKMLGIHNAIVNIVINLDTVKVAIKGTGVKQIAQIVNRIIDFGDVEIGTHRDTIHVATIKNVGNTQLHIINTKHGLPNDADFTTLSGGGDFYISQNDTAWFDLRFTPSFAGRTNGTLELYYNGIDSPAIIQLIGNGYYSYPIINASVQPFSDIICEDSSFSTLNIKNEGIKSLIITGIRTKGTDKELFHIDFINSITVEAGKSISLPIIFASSQIGLKTADFEITSNAYPDSLTSIKVTAKKDSANIIPEFIEINMGNIAINKTWSSNLYLKNDGSTTNKAIITTPNGFSLDKNELLLASGARLPISISFPGSATVGTIDETFLITDTICNQTTVVRIYGEISSGGFIQSITQIGKNLSCDRNFTDSIYIKNAGVDKITIKNINFTNPNYKLSNTFSEFDLDSNQGTYINYQFESYIVGNNNSDMIFTYFTDKDVTYTIKLNTFIDSVNISPLQKDITLYNVCHNSAITTNTIIKNYGTNINTAIISSSPKVTIDKSKFSLDKNAEQNINIEINPSPSDLSIDEIITITDTVCNKTQTIHIIANIIKPAFNADKLEISGFVGTAAEGLLTIHNTSNIDITIANPPVLSTEFTFEPNQFPLTISANGSKPLKILYTANDFVNDTIIGTIQAEPCSISADITLIGTPRNATARIYSKEITANVGSEIELPVYFEYESADGIQPDKAINVKIEFNSTVLSALNYQADFENNNIGVINLNNLILPQTLNGTLANIRFKVGLGNANNSEILFTVDPLQSNLTINEENTKFNVGNICYEGGPRLINPNSSIKMKIKPIPAKTVLDIEITTNYKEQSKIEIVNSLGEIIMSRELNLEINSPNELSFDIRNLSSGIYFIRLSSLSNTILKSFVLVAE